MKENKIAIIFQIVLVFLVGAVMFELSNENMWLSKELDVYKSAYKNLANQEQEPQKESVYEIAERIYDIEAELLEAIERHETGNYTSEVYVMFNNTWGAIEGNKHKLFDSAEQSTLELARCLKFYYYNYDLTTLEEIASEFAPNDIDEWATDVEMIYKELKK